MQNNNRSIDGPKVAKYLVYISDNKMIQPEMPYQQYCSLHRQFVDEYKTISARIAELYQSPKRFIEENASAMDLYMAESAMPGSPERVDANHLSIRQFIHKIEDFKLQIMSVFFEHRMLLEKCTSYMQKVQQFKLESNEAEMEMRLTGLIPELSSLRFGLKCVEERAATMMGQLGTVEANWNYINGKQATR